MCVVNKANTFRTTKKWLKTGFAIIKRKRITSLYYIYSPIVFHLKLLTQHRSGILYPATTFDKLKSGQYFILNLLFSLS